MPAAKPLTKVEKAYVESQYLKVSVADIARDLKLPVGRVRKVVEALKAADAARPPAPPTEGPGHASKRPNALERLLPLSGSGNRTGAAVMTPDQAMADDADAGSSPFGSTPVLQVQRDYVLKHKDDMSLEAIAKEASLPLFVVRQIVDAANRPQEGREAFYNRHRKNIHKIRPDEPFQ